jgi:2,3-bisphosphoglycerate-dependent phosphoglycerate mutase
MSQLVFIRHGQSQWNKRNLFTGWVDVGLTEQGMQEAIQAGRLLKEKGYHFNQAYASVLKRSIHTLWTVLAQMNLSSIPVTKHWRLNERHYGDLQGKNKKETAEQFGAEQVKIWRRSYDTPPPAKTDQVGNEPASESLKDTVDRVVPYWEQTIYPQWKAGHAILIAAHGNSLRGLIKHLVGISEEDIVQLEIPTGVPIILKRPEGSDAFEYEFLSE